MGYYAALVKVGQLTDERHTEFPRYLIAEDIFKARDALMPNRRIRDSIDSVLDCKEIDEWQYFLGKQIELFHPGQMYGKGEDTRTKTIKSIDQYFADKDVREFFPKVRTGAEELLTSIEMAAWALREIVKRKRINRIRARIS
ncbi:MAG: hypothetical protein V1837_03555 [Candidatus Woesearchaeota archaeon]